MGRKISYLAGRPEKLFLVVGMVFGLLYLVITPPFQVADEDRHYYRAYQVAEGGLVSQVKGSQAGGSLPVSVIECGASTTYMRWDWQKQADLQEVLAGFSAPLDASRREFVEFRSATYSPVAYLPAAAVMRVGIWLGVSPLGLMYAGRLVNLAVWLAAIYWAIRLVPFYKWLFFLLALTPTSLYQGASLSADSVTHGLAFLTTAYFLALGCGETERVGRKAVALAAVLLVLLVLTKNYLVFFPLLYWLIPGEKFSGARQRWLGFALLMGVTVAAVFAWWLVVRELPIVWRAKVEPGGQMAYILGHPGEYAVVVLRTILQNFHWYAARFVGAFGWQTVHVPKAHSLLWALVLLGAAFTGGRQDRRIAPRQKVVLAGVAGLTVLGMFTLLYVYWNAVGATWIEGIQGRYYIPVAGLGLLVLDNRWVYLTQWRWRTPLVAGATVVSLAISAVLIVRRFWA